MELVEFRSPKSKNRHGGTVLDDTDMSGRRNGTSKEGRKTTRVSRAMWHDRVTMARGDRATWYDRTVLYSGVDFLWRLGFTSACSLLSG